ncbi:adenosine deaminase [Oceanirhabdus sp. W0125-5]|uniref:adenosine deaminase n=1 Tax=Oceanirhabdus sp. W0125-5 TaxID=2999116 RepID=UPI0022F3150B|nr:adenosine deaminase [Oceanirhabdus sp. W0125-5]WBW97862.1 adenosine deaminase [Oceanirhabdus sp. W0125-5]
MEIKRLPKIELHCHLDGSVRPETLFELSKKEGLDLGVETVEEFRKLVEAPQDCKSLDEYLEKFDIANKVMQTKENITRITYELMEDVAADNVKYIEIRFAPLLHINKGLTFEEIVESVISGIKRGEEEFGIHGNLILSCMRTMPVEACFEVVEKGAKYLGKGVVAVDLCSSERAGFPEVFKAPINLAKKLGYRITIHAGETGIGENVLKSIELLDAERIGHGVYSKDCPEAYKLLKEKNVVLEVCPTSNVQTKAVVSYEEHPMKEYFEDGIKVTINTDNMTVSNTDLNKEYEILEDMNIFNEDDYKQMYMYGVEASFATEEVKEKLRSYIY